MIRVAIVDDEPLARRGVRARLAALPDIQIVGECADGLSAVQVIRDKAPDLVFLDIQMPGLDGFGVLERLDAARMPVVIFLTAFDEHAIRAFDAAALDYLLKPIDDERFSKSVERARSRVAERRGGRTTPHSGRIAVRDRGRIVLLNTDDVEWLEADGDYVRIHATGRGHLTRETMKAIEQRLPAGQFVRIHRSAIVNVARIKELVPKPNREFVVVLRDGTKLKLSRGFRDRLDALMAGANHKSFTKDPI